MPEPHPDVPKQSAPASDSAPATTAADPFDRAPLHYAAALGDLAEVTALLDGGADPQEQDAAGFTALHFAAQEQRADMTKLLIDAGADLHARDRWGNTPLWRAVMHSHGRMETISVLLAAGADPDEVNVSGVSPRALGEKMQEKAGERPAL